MAIDFHSRTNRGAHASRRADDGWKAAISRIVEPTGKRVADIGCGGIYSLAWHELGASSVTGVDFSQATVDAACERAAGPADISFRQGDAAAIGLPSASVDIVFERALIHHAQDCYWPCFAEAHRVLAAGGTLIVQDRTPDDVRLPGSVEHLRGYFFECFPRLLAIENARQPTDKAVRTALAAAGFAEVETSVLWEVRKVHRDRQGLRQDLAKRTGRSILHDLSDEELAELIRYIEQRLPADGPIVEKDRWTVWSAVA